MSHIRKREFLRPGDSVFVECSEQASVILLNDDEYSNYKAGRRYKFHGGRFERYPAILTADRTDWWNVVIDLGRAPNGVDYSINFMKT